MDWPISWQKVKDLSGNTGGGSGSGLPVIDLTRFYLIGGGPNKMEGTIEDFAAVRAMINLNGMPFIARFIYDTAMMSDDGHEIYERYNVIMNYINTSEYTGSSPFEGYVGNVGNMVFKIMSPGAPGSDFFVESIKMVSVTY